MAIGETITAAARRRACYDNDAATDQKNCRRTRFYRTRGESAVRINARDYSLSPCVSAWPRLSLSSSFEEQSKIETDRNVRSETGIRAVAARVLLRESPLASVYAPPLIMKLNRMQVHRCFYIVLKPTI